MELITAVTGAESVINSTPLVDHIANPDDDVPITSNHFFHRRIGREFATDSVYEGEYHPKNRW